MAIQVCQCGLAPDAWSSSSAFFALRPDRNLTPEPGVAYPFQPPRVHRGGFMGSREQAPLQGSGQRPVVFPSHYSHIFFNTSSLCPGKMRFGSSISFKHTISSMSALNRLAMLQSVSPLCTV